MGTKTQRPTGEGVAHLPSSLCLQHFARLYKYTMKARITKEELERIVGDFGYSIVRGNPKETFEVEVEPIGKHEKPRSEHVACKHSPEVGSCCVCSDCNGHSSPEDRPEKIEKPMLFVPFLEDAFLPGNNGAEYLNTVLWEIIEVLNRLQK